VSARLVVQKPAVLPAGSFFRLTQTTKNGQVEFPIHCLSSRDELKCIKLRQPKKTPSMAFVLHLFCRALFGLGADLTSIVKNAALFRCRIHRPISHNPYSLTNFVTFSSRVACCNWFVQIEYSVDYLVIQLSLNKFMEICRMPSLLQPKL